jgi:uncharacterized surface protein with fasciclin (FAS1) repeats
MRPCPNKAFAKLPKDQLDALMANKTLLTAVLNYHLVPGEVMSTDLKNGMTVKTVAGENLIISLVNGGVMVNDAPSGSARYRLYERRDPRN